MCVCFQPLDDNKTLGDSGFTSSTARAQMPATIGLAYKDECKYDCSLLTAEVILASKFHERKLFIQPKLVRFSSYSQF